MADVRLVVDAKNALGEGPIWDVSEQRIYWIDSLGQKIFRAAPDGSEIEQWGVPAAIGSLALRRQGGAVLALETGFHLFDFETGRAELLIDPEADQPHTRLNDGKVDRRGRFVVGSIDMATTHPTPPSELNGALYRLDPDLSLHKLEGGVGQSNGPCWSPDGRTFYFTDSASSRIWAYDWDLDSGTPSNKRLFTTPPLTKEIPDGATVDSEGYFWNAMNGVLGYPGEVRRYAPDGRLDRRIELPVVKITSVAFGGPNLDVLYVTSMSLAIGDASDRPLDGGLFAIQGLGVQGIEEPRFAG